MKKVFTLFSILVLVLGINPLKAQEQIDVDLIVFEPLPEIDLGALLIAKDLKGAPRVFQLMLNPLPQYNIIVSGNMEWKRSSSEGYKFLYSFKTKPFTARNFSNNEIGTSDIVIDTDNSDTDLLEELFKKGKPTGAIRIFVEVRDENNRSLGANASDSEELNFLNPAQTLSIRSPEAESIQNIGGVLAEWDDITGVGSYSIRANVRKNVNQSFEEALKSGNPLINDKDVGSVTSVNLRELLDREWLPGQEIVLQVTANIPGALGVNKLYSNIINFRFEAASQEETNTMNQNLVNLFENIGDEETSRILSLLQNGEISLEDVTISSGDGQIMTVPEFQNLMNYLETNPDAVISIKYNSK